MKKNTYVTRQIYDCQVAIVWKMHKKIVLKTGANSQSKKALFINVLNKNKYWSVKKNCLVGKCTTFNAVCQLQNEANYKKTDAQLVIIKWSNRLDDRQFVYFHCKNISSVIIVLM